MKKFAVIFTAAIIFISLTSVCQRKNAANANPKNAWALEFSHNDKFFAIAGDDSTLFIYNAHNFQLYKKHKLKGMIKNIAWHRSDSIIAVATLNNVQLFHVNTGTSSVIQNVSGARGIGWNKTGELLGIAGGRGLIYIVDAKGKLITSFKKGDEKSYLTLDWSADNIIATGSDEIILSDTSGKQLSFIEHRKEYRTGVLTIRWHPSGEFFAIGDYGHENEDIPTNLQFRKKDGSLIKTIAGHHSEIRNVRWNKEGSLLATAADALRIYDRNGTEIATSFTPGKYDIWSVAWSNDGKTILTSSFSSNHLDVWDANGKHIRQLF